MAELYNNESSDLELHVSICHERYKQLDNRMERLEKEVIDIKNDIKSSNTSLRSTIITSSGTIIVAILGLITTILLK